MEASIFDISKLRENLNLWPRSKVWAELLQSDKDLPPELKSILRQHINTATAWERVQSIAAIDQSLDIKEKNIRRYSYRPRRKGSRSRGSVPCRGCGKILPHDDLAVRRCLWIQCCRRWAKRSWENLSPEQKSRRTAAARAAKLRKHYDKKLLDIDPRIISVMGREAVIQKLRAKIIP